MDVKNIKDFIESYLKESPRNFIDSSDALKPELCGMQIYDGCLVGIASAKDSLFINEFKTEAVIHPDHKAPREWMENASSVISFFLPFCDNICESNKNRVDQAFDESITNQRCSTEWLHARIEGQNLVSDLCTKLCEYVQSEGYEAMCPMRSKDFKMIVPKRISNWSERHVAYAAGLGTFSLSKGIITERGTAGRLGSIITNAEITPTHRTYTDPFEYCTMCGACERNCPVHAIDKARGMINGKDKASCSDYLDGGYLVPWGPKQTVRYGCGKCQVKVPCQNKIPAKRNTLKSAKD